MFLKIYQKVVAIITAANLGFTEIVMYKGELEEGAEWRFKMPVCLVELADDIPGDQLAGDLISETETRLELYVCDKDTTEPKILNKVNSVLALFDGTDVKIDTDNFKARYLGTSLHAYLPGTGKAYKIVIGIH
ncbi:MAG TPA: hypothetical protein PK605_00390 [Ignavibacteria bacterium]|nr:hypothetical protein [Bacteroidota bacterium]HRE10762.1 hypothetical protein [Ignavibacteria bacterium]HRF65996.1 hypothetical protein [Ignavibacteria bacterium]HRJ02837.1 hypothetical protein [Ignavibacteria bacterium]HRJ84395.1 hypothetical protein [Ignavibacteria bacterium]